MEKVRRRSPLECREVVWRELTEDPFGLRSYPLRLTETPPFVWLMMADLINN